jgi:iron complex outermembrane receptor protein
VRNAADKFAIANDIISAPLYANVRVGTVMPPRTYGITFGYKF